MEAILPENSDHLVCTAGDYGGITNFLGQGYDMNNTNVYYMLKTQHLKLMVSIVM